MAYLWTQKAWRHNGAVIKLHSLLFLPVLHFSPSEGYSLKKTFAIHFQSSPKKQELLYWGIAKDLGHYVGCAMLDWSLETELFSPFFSFLNPTSSGKKPAPNIIRWIFKRTKAPVQFFTLPVGRGGKKSMKQTETPRVCVHTHKPIVLDISVELISEDYFNDNLTLSSICLSLQLCPKKWQGFRCVRVKTKAENTGSGAICSGFAYLIMNAFQRPQDK